MISVDWATGQAFTGWLPEIPGTEWAVGFDTIGFSHLSTEYLLVPVQAIKAGVAYNPSADPVQFAFMPTATQVPGVGDWVNGSWDTNASAIYPYTAKCLVGPTGTVNLALGTYVIYVKITDNPETPVLVGGQLVIS